MHLKQLTLKGFKSFADPVTLDLEPGVCVVVGPNGSGKSNIVDAVAWVLGSQSPKSVRSQKMDDVIFAGTATRQALGRAEVTLTIDNSDGSLALDLTEITVTRRLFRSGDSEYEINGASCRLLDVQELLSDSGVGRTQHVIVSQGQLDGVLNARPEERRSIIEEAAGVLKHRRRREKALRRMESTDADLLRAQDLVREVRRQLGPLRRQADAALRHDSVVAELALLRSYLAGRELAALRARLESAHNVQADLARGEAEAHHALSALEAQVLAAEAEVSSVIAVSGAGDLADELTRAESLRERARGLGGLVAERRRGVERSLQAQADESVAASLESDSARLAAELEEVELAALGLRPDLDSLAAAEEALADERRRFDLEWGDGTLPIGASADHADRPVLTAAEVRGELSALRQAADRVRGQQARVLSRLAALTQRAERLAGEAVRLGSEVTGAAADEGSLESAVTEAARARAAAEHAEVLAHERAVACDAERARCEARRDALAQALDEARARAGAERLAGVDGVVGTLLELVEVDDGWGDAFEAACGEAIAAVVVDGSAAARAALAHLSAGERGGAVVALPDPGASIGLPLLPGLQGVEPVRSHVRSRLLGLDTLLDVLLERAVCVPGTWEEAIDLALDRADLVVVTRTGDRFASTAWRAGAGGTGATGSALEAADAAVTVAVEAADAAAATRQRTRDAAAGARRAEVDAARTRQANATRTTAATTALERVEAERRDVETEGAALSADAEEMAGRVEREAARLAELELLLPDLEAEESEGRERNLAHVAARRQLEEQERSAAGRRRDLEVRSAGLMERKAFLTRKREEVEARLRRFVAERSDAESRRRRLEREAEVLADASTTVEASLRVVEEVVADLRERRARQSALAKAATERLDRLRRERQATDRRLGEVRERQQRADHEETENRMRAEVAVLAMRRDLGLDPEAAVAMPEPEVPEGTTAEKRVAALDRDLRLMGPVNPLALEELNALEERARFLEKELDDVKASRRELAKVVRAIDGEIVEVFAAAYADVSNSFDHLFGALFPGGTGRLRLTTPDDLLNTGIEVEAKPSGKNVKSLALLSGGERSLVALALLFAVFRSRPSPFYLMDEVEAALDDVNLHRFLGLLDEFRTEAQILIVSHQKRTMEAADCLYGVTMQPGGSSKVVSERVRAGA